jgi:integrase
MARRVRNTKLDTRSARSKLAQRREPYWTAMSSGLALGYRRGSTGGTWIAKHYSPESRRRYQAIGPSDDILDADGKKVFNFDQAQTKARDWLAKLTKQEVNEVDCGPYTVANATDDYFRFLVSDGRPAHTIRDAQYRDNAFIRSKLGSVEVTSLTTERLRRWRDDLVKTPPRLRTRRGEDQKHRHIAGDDARRARRASANRTWTILRAALNHAFTDGKISSDLAWRKVKPFKAVDVARVRYLTIAEAKRLINAADSDFRLLVQAALQTGARYGELVRLTVADFNPDVGTVAIRRSKSGRSRHIVLTDEGRAFFRQITAGRAGDELILRNMTRIERAVEADYERCKSAQEKIDKKAIRNRIVDDGAWRPSHQLRPMAEAVKRAKIRPAISFHGLRHTWASLSVMAGVPLLIVARNLGHADTRMVEKHYGHLAPSYIADAIRKGAPRFGFKLGRKDFSRGS